MLLSIVIPTFNRLDALAACLASIVRQEGVDFGELEVIVANDGGDAAAEATCRDALGGSPRRIAWRYLHAEHAGPAAVRNFAVCEARGDLVLFLNDDVTLEPGHLAAHLAFHARNRTLERMAGIGFAEASPGREWEAAEPLIVAAKGLTEWAPEEVDTPLMRWLARQSFTYFLIDDPRHIGYEYYHTSDVSLPRLLVTDIVPFDEAFPYPGFEDTEWGCRIEERGWRIALLPAARTMHHHRYDEAALLRRSWANGVCAAYLFERVAWLRGRAIDDFIRREEIPLGRWRRLPRWLLAALWRRRSGRQPGGREAAPRDHLERAWASRSVGAEAGPARWGELARREHVRGFLETYQRRNGIPYPW